MELIENQISLLSNEKSGFYLVIILPHINRKWKCTQKCTENWTCTHLLKKSITDNFIFCPGSSHYRRYITHLFELISRSEKISYSCWLSAVNSGQTCSRVRYLEIFSYESMCHNRGPKNIP